MFKADYYTVQYIDGVPFYTFNKKPPRRHTK